MVELTQVKTYLGITSDSDNDRLTAILDGVNAKVKSKVGDLSLGTKVVQILDNTPIVLNIINPTAVTKINGNTIASTEYIIKYDGEVKVKDLCLYTENDFGVYEVEFTAGFEEAPESLIAIVSKYVGYLYSQDLGKNIVSEQLGPRGVTYDKFDESSFSNELTQFIPLALRVW